jgi:hypothetical protein
MNIVGFFGALVRKAVYSAERDRISDKFDHLDSRLDVLERDVAVVKHQTQSLHEVSTANLEAIEQKVNATNASMQALDLIVKHHLAYMGKVLQSIQDTLKAK